MTLENFSVPSSATYVDDATDSGSDDEAMRENVPPVRARGGRSVPTARGGKQFRRLHFPVDQLQQYYHLPLKVAAQELGICEAALKRICRRNHIKKWPYRQLQSITRRIEEESHLDAVQFAFEHNLISVDTDASSEFMLPHELESRRKMSTALFSQLACEQRQRMQRVRRLNKEKQAIIDTAHIASPPPTYHAVEDYEDDEVVDPSLDQIHAEDALDILASLCVNELSRKRGESEQECKPRGGRHDDGDVHSVEVLSCMMANEI